MRQFLYRGTPSLKKVDVFLHRNVQAAVTPYLVLEDHRVGILLVCSPLTGSGPFEVMSRGCEPMNELALWWRAVRCIERLPVLTDQIVHFDAYYGMHQHTAEGTPERRAANRIQTLLGYQEYRQITCTRMPQEIRTALALRTQEKASVPGRVPHQHLVLPLLS